MHSHDRTLLARLGFADPDKQEPLHDRACAYLAEDAQSRRIVGIFDDGRAPHDSARERRNGPPCVVAAAEGIALSEASIYSDVRVDLDPHLEVPLTKGEGQYATTIGYLDLLLGYAITARDSGWFCDGGVRQRSDGARRLVRGGEIIIEVKIRRPPIGDVLRQMNLYRQHSAHYSRPVQHYIVATTYALGKSEVDTLLREKIRHVRLGDAFRAWCERPAEDGDSPCI